MGKYGNGIKVSDGNGNGTGMGMESFKWEGIGTKNLFPHTSSLHGKGKHLGVILNGVAMGWAKWAKSGCPECRGQRVLGKIKNNNFPRYSELDHLNIEPLFMLYGRVVHVGETCNRLADFGL